MTQLKTTARIAGLWYLGLAVGGVLGFLLVRPALYLPDDAPQTVRNLVEQPHLATASVGLELLIVVTQALAAVWFFKLFRTLNAVAAAAIFAFGLVNATAILASAAFLATAVDVAQNASLAPGGDIAGTVQLLAQVSANCWGVGGLFFGLWLIPMGHVVVESGRMPKVLGWILMGGGACYVLSTFLAHSVFGVPTWLTDALTLPPTVGEFWMIGYLLSVGIREEATASVP